MKLWNCSWEWLTLVVRARDEAEACRVALPAIREYGAVPDDWSDEDVLGEIGPMEIPLEGAARVVIEDAS